MPNDPRTPMNRVHGTLLAGAAVVAAITVVVSNKNHPARGDGGMARQPSSESQKPPEKSKSTESPRRKLVPLAGLPPPMESLPPPVESPHPPVESPHPPGSAESRDWIATRQAELERMAWFDDTESLHRILTELRNTLPEIRAAALAATISFGSRDAAPHLEKIAATTADPQEKKALEDAIDFLKLASLDEYLEEQQPTVPELPPSE